IAPATPINAGGQPRILPPQVCARGGAGGAVHRTVLPSALRRHQFIGDNGLSAISIDTERKILCLTGKKKEVRHRMLRYRDILSAEIIQDSYSVTKTSRTSQAGAALLGGVLFGGVGAVVGALTGTR